MSDVFTFGGVGNEAMGLRVLPQTAETLGLPLDRVYQVVPGRDGSYLMGTRRGVKTFVLPVAVMSTSDADAQTQIDAIATWLTTDASAPLTFEDRPGSAYYAQVDGEVTFSRVAATYRTASLKLVCADPHRYAAFPTVLDIGSGDTTITNPGGLAVPATLDLTFATPATFVRAQVGGMYCGIGQPAQPTDTVFTPESVMLHDDCSAVWGASTVGAPVSGTMVTNGLAVGPIYEGGSFGTGSGWHGPSDERAFPSVGGSYTAQDFTMTARCRVDNRVPSNATQLAAYNAAVKAHGKTSSQARSALTTLNTANALMATMGRTTVYALAADDSVVASMYVGDLWTNTQQVAAVFSVTGKSTDLLNTTGPSPTSYNNFDGTLTLSRIGSVWTAKSCQIDSKGREVSTKTATWTDKAGTTLAPVARAARHFAQYGTALMVADLNISQIDVKRINTKPVATAPEHIAEVGDTITFEGWDIRKNGVPFTAPVDFGSDLVLLPTGDSTLNITTDGDFASATATIHPAWL